MSRTEQEIIITGPGGYRADNLCLRVSVQNLYFLGMLAGGIIYTLGVNRPGSLIS
jgi:hypothetical protein